MATLRSVSLAASALVLLAANTLAATTAQICSAAAMTFWDTPPTFAEPIVNPAAFNNSIWEVKNNASWSQYNSNDVSAYKEGDFYYTVGTDSMVGYGDLPRRGIQLRRSSDLVKWTYVGWLLSDSPSWAKTTFWSGGNGSIWNPEIFTLSNGTLVVYYCVTQPFTTNSAIGLAASTSGSILGPWVDRGMIFRTYQGNSSNAVGPSVFYDHTGRLWLAYGAGGTLGIWIKELNATTGLPLSTTDLGTRIAYRGSGNMDAPKIMYRYGFYYLFLSYDTFNTDYNVRVARSVSPNGPYYDMLGNDMTVANANSGTKLVNQHSFTEPGVAAPYGWVGLGHPGLLSVSLNRSEGRYDLLLHNARPAINSVWMHLHVRRLFWTPEGWPVVSPTRYGGEALDATLPISDSWWGTYEHMSFPPYYNTNFTSVSVKIGPCGSASGYWPVTVLGVNSGRIPFGGDSSVDVIFSWGWDWIRARKTIVYSGYEIGGSRSAVWGIRVA